MAKAHSVQKSLPLAGVAALVSTGVALAQTSTVRTQAGAIKRETIVSGLAHPWAINFLPDGRMLVTERPGRLRIVSAKGDISPPLSGVPAVAARGQGGLLDVVPAPDFERSRLIYISYAEPGPGGTASTAVARGRLNEASTGLTDVKVVFSQQPKVDGNGHFGARLVFARDGTLFISLGERMKFDPAQDLSSHLGKIVRINPDGSVPKDNPFVDRQDVRPEIWSYGHRNSQGATLDPRSGAIWTVEHGPRGGDELNKPEPGKNYGWPLVSWGNHYGGTPIPKPDSRKDLADAVKSWSPVISPSGMTFYTGNLIPAWKGSLLLGGLSSEAVTRLTLDGDRVTSEERIPIDRRVRDVRQGPDGAIYIVTDDDNGRILRLSPG